MEDDLDLIDERALPLVRRVLAAGGALPAVGYELSNETGGLVEVAWTEQRVAVVIDEDPDRDLWLSEKGWWFVHARGCEPELLLKALGLAGRPAVTPHGPDADPVARELVEGVVLETPRELLARLKLGREETVQRLLTTLILQGHYPPWNSRSRPAPSGVGFLRDLHAEAFGASWPGEPATFVDEFELPPRHLDERGGAPDYAVLWDRNLWMISPH